MTTTQESFNCIFCKDTFQDKEALQIHFRKHGDPKFNPSTKNKVSYRHETQTSTEEGEMVSCDVCSDVFPTISKAITHKHKVHPDHDAKYFCPWCGKLFTMKHLYNKHINASHKDAEASMSNEFHCDPCDITFHIPSGMIYHNKFFHRQDTEMPSIGQSRKVKLTNQEAVPIYYCAFCGEEYNNKVNLHKHMCDDHSDENQSPEDILRCPLCDAVFYHLDAYELHITYHSTEDVYNEKNQMAEEINEFSLETVPPIVEKVENYETNDDPESTINALGIETFLQLAIDQSVEDGEISGLPKDYIKVKTKKHKKHKKTKKAAITLDEFLNMNKDVFGEGLDFEGVEEIPSRAVAKRLKVKKQPVAKAGSKATSSKKDLEKLKKQGIVVKMKSTKNPVILGRKVAKGKTGNQKEGKELHTNKNKPIIQTQTKSNAVSMSSEVLTKLINQSNNQIKIVKRPAKNNLVIEEQSNTSKLTQSDTTNNLEKMHRLSSPEKNEFELKLRNTPSTEKEHETNLVFKDNVDTIYKSLDDDVGDTNTMENNVGEELCSYNKNNSEQVNDVGDPKLNICSESPKQNYKTNRAENSALNSLLSVNQHLTIKPVSQLQTNNIIENSSPICEKDEDDDAQEDNTDDEIKQSENVENALSNDDNDNSNSLKALKHLSNFITVKPVSQTNILIKKESKETPVSVSKQSQNNLNQSDDSLNESDKSKNDNKKSLDVLKILNKSITIKSVPSPKLSERASSDEDTLEDNLNTKIYSVVNKNIKEVPQNKSQNQLNTIKNQTTNKLTNAKIGSPMSSPDIKTNNSSKVTESVKTPEKSNMRSNAALFKNLSNVTAKPIIGAIKNLEEVKTNKIVNQMTNQKTSTPKISKKEEIKEEIEIFNIDDSDSEEEKHNNSNNKSTKITTTQNHSMCSSSTSNDALKSLNKQITIKTANQETQKINTYQSDQTNKIESSFDESDDEYQQGKSEEKSNLSHQNSKNILLQKTLKNLSKHITIKSRNSSPCPSAKSQDQNTQDINEQNIMNEDDESDSDSCSSKVKITELNDDDDVAQEDVDEMYEINKNSNIIIQSPEMSDNEDVPEDTDDQFIDIESKLVANTLQKGNKNSNLDTLKNISKSITVKTVNEKRPTQTEMPISVKAGTSNPNNFKKDLHIKPTQNNQAYQDYNEESINNSNKVIGRIKQPIKQTINKNVSNQVSAINKEVTVKTFEKKTVIQEITTTVTKTIKTVNQTVQQEVQSTSQSTCTPTIRPNKVQEMKQYQQSTNKYQGIVVRHASPVCGTKIRGAITPVRPVVGTSIKHSNQIVPVRPNSNVRAATPRNVAVRKNVGNTSIQNPNSKTPVKNPPNAMKRSPSQEASGPFSCFKKPKESLIPVSDIPAYSGESDTGSTVQFASATHVSKNIMNITKTVKGNTTVTTQMKSELSSNSQQLSKLSSMAGLKIVKTSQVKQVSNVEQNKDLCASKRTTLEAIEKLQKHGLLVKKPRLDVQNNDNKSEHSDNENFSHENEEEFTN